MFRTESRQVISPTDLVDTMECEHRSALRIAAAEDLPGAPAPTDLDPLVAQQGAAHEQAELDRLRGLFGDGVVAIADPAPTDAAMRAAAEATAEAMRAGAPVVYQACFYDPVTTGVAFHGRADFLISTAVDPATGAARPGAPVRYEPWDTKLARRPGPSAILQLTAYAAALERTETGRGEHMHLITGDRGVHTHRVAEFLPILEGVRRRLLQALGEPPALPHPLWAPPRPACDGCGYSALCAEGRAAARHLSLVAGLRADQARRLDDCGISTIDALAGASEDARPPAMPRHSFARLREQAALQVRQDATRTAEDPQGTVIAEVHSSEGLASLPEPGPGDVFFDMEGYPYYDGADGRGLEYLFGAVTPARGEGDEEFHAFWAHDRAQEKRAFEDFVDFVCERIDADPGAHVYHYASYEADRLKLLAAAFGTREAEVDELLRHRRLVDLYTAVKKSLRVSQRSYSIKYLEPLYLPQSRGGEVTTAASSIDAYADYLAAAEAGETERAGKIVRSIADYNRDDCVSTARLRDWLEDLRTRNGITARPAGQSELVAEDADERAAERRRRRDEQEARLHALTGPLLDGVPDDPAARTPDQHARALLASLAGYYRREENPSWWDYFRRVSAPMEELEADNECLVPLRARMGEWQEPTGRRKLARREVELRADPARPHPFAAGDSVRLLYAGAPGQEADTVNAAVETSSPERLTLVETSSPGETYARAPAAVLPGAPVRSAPKDDALWSLAAEAVEALPELPPHAGLDVLCRRPPRTRGGAGLPDPAEHGGDLVSAVIAAVDRLDSSYLAVQGPPGAGKTYLAARLITHLVASGRTVGVCSTSHKAVENVLSAAAHAARTGPAAPSGDAAPHALAVAKRPPAGKADPRAPWDQPKSPKDLAAWRAEHTGGHLVGGTAWNLANEAMRADPLDVLIIDEAGQFALADTLAVSSAARDLVLLGDPQQLPQVVQGAHGEGAAASALEHLVGGAEIIDPDLGYFLDQTRRMHPNVCAPVSQLSYRGVLRAHPSAAERVMGGLPAGLYRYEIDHTGRATHSPEEVEAVVAIAADLVGRTFREPGAVADREVTGEDVLVVAPFNLQVRALRQALDAAGLPGVRAGTVDRFQGQEAPAVICSMTVSSAADAARGLDFVLSRNRLNVALSRAQTVAALVYSPQLIASAPRSVAELRVLAGFAGLREAAAPRRSPAPSAAGRG
ncbi:TM0106 family RecB-like putative nuclease [Streptomonospora wellingtoniae]|uniref:TM0106 family RecB-like putative nuclease n=1 Tax=Streptomonospora wellingtoniae TaxID=3075544 RepID=A0ABU2KWS4_9ACTN|nr:TM0106 family RecB-like putative nuclease [Streptomonospora sp. DSM 45055]MDT0303754.1 TM0106 family RecB-like putative nuclease [Streptomonospora sp. DSM 45055]